MAKPQVNERRRKQLVLSVTHPPTLVAFCWGKTLLHLIPTLFILSALQREICFKNSRHHTQCPKCHNSCLRTTVCLTLCEINNYKQVKQTPPENDVQVLDVSWLKKRERGGKCWGKVMCRILKLLLRKLQPKCNTSVDYAILSKP